VSSCGAAAVCTVADELCLCESSCGNGRGPDLAKHCAPMTTDTPCAPLHQMEDATTLEEIICFRRIALRQAPPPKEGEKPDKAALAQAGGGRRWWSRIRAASQRVTGRGGGGAGEAWSETDLQVGASPSSSTRRVG
jgi:hypothetical protein